MPIPRLAPLSRAVVIASRRGRSSRFSARGCLFPALSCAISHGCPILRKATPIPRRFPYPWRTARAASIASRLGQRLGKVRLPRPRLGPRPTPVPALLSRRAPALQSTLPRFSPMMGPPLPEQTPGRAMPPQLVPMLFPRLARVQASPASPFPLRGTFCVCAVSAARRARARRVA